jgi:hypothetical protein
VLKKLPQITAHHVTVVEISFDSHIDIPKVSSFLGCYRLLTGKWLLMLPGNVGGYLPVDSASHPNFMLT